MYRQFLYLTLHRGMKELSYLLGLFVERTGTSILEDPCYQELLSYDDILLWDSIVYPHSSAIPEHLSPLIEQIRDIHFCDHPSKL